MRYNLSILAFAMLIASCNSGKSKEEKPTGNDTISGPTPDLTDRTVKDTLSKTGEKDAIGGLSLGLADTKTVEILGQPDSKTKAEEWGADGLMHQDWVYKTKGITLNMSGEKDKAQEIASITI